MGTGEGGEEKKAFPSPWWTKVLSVSQTDIPDNLFHRCESMCESFLGH